MRVHMTLNYWAEGDVPGGSGPFVTAERRVSVRVPVETPERIIVESVSLDDGKELLAHFSLDESGRGALEWFGRIPPGVDRSDTLRPIRQGAVAIDSDGYVWQLYTFRGDGRDLRWWMLPPSVLQGTAPTGPSGDNIWRTPRDVPGVIVWCGRPEDPPLRRADVDNPPEVATDEPR